MSIISFINLKGGVGKSTTTVAFAEFLAGYHQRRVLVIDLDPQTNASIALIGDQRWGALNRESQTLHRVFLTPFASPPRHFCLQNIIARGASSVIECADRIDLLASSTDLIGQESVVEAVATVSHYEMESHTVLAKAFAEDPTILQHYDDVLIDCPPSLNIVTLNGLFLSDAYLIPVMPEPISIYGIPQIINRIQRLKTRFGRVIPALGILINRFDNSHSRFPEQQEQALRQMIKHSRQSLNSETWWPDLFREHIYERTTTTRAMQPALDTQSLASKYDDHNTNGYSSFYKWITITREFIERCTTLTISRAS